MFGFARIVAGVLILAGLSGVSWAGPVKNEFLVNKYTSSDQRVPDIAHLADGGFVIVWESGGEDGSSYGVFAQRYNANGRKVGKQGFRVNKTTDSDQRNPQVEGLAGGGFVVAWESFEQDGDGWGVYARQYNAAGKKVGRKEFKVSRYTTSDQYAPDIAALDKGGYVIVWTSNGQDGDSTGIYGQRYNSTAKRIGGQFKVNKTTDNAQSEPAAAGLDDGGFVVVWKSYGQGGNGYGVYGQRYNKKGKRAGRREFMINKELVLEAHVPSVAGLEGGGFVAVYDLYDTESFIIQVFAQRYDSDGKRVGKREFRVNMPSFGDDERNSRVAALAGGGFVVIWQTEDGDGDSWGIFGQRYNQTGKPAGPPEFPINTYTTSAQFNPSVAGLTGGKFVATWQSLGQDGSGQGVYGQQFRP